MIWQLWFYRVRATHTLITMFLSCATHGSAIVALSCAAHRLIIMVLSCTTPHLTIMVLSYATHDLTIMILSFSTRGLTNMVLSCATHCLTIIVLSCATHDLTIVRLSCDAHVCVPGCVWNICYLGTSFVVVLVVLLLLLLLLLRKWSWCSGPALYLFASQVTVIVNESELCCCVPYYMSEVSRASLTPCICWFFEIWLWIRNAQGMRPEMLSCIFFFFFFFLLLCKLVKKCWTKQIKFIQKLNDLA